MAWKVTIYSPVRSENPLSNSIAAIRHSLAPIENALLKPSGVDGSIPIGGKPKADKNQSKANVSAYKTAQGQGKPASSPFAKKT
jgi:hypothetical protein